MALTKYLQKKALSSVIAAGCLGVALFSVDVFSQMSIKEAELSIKVVDRNGSFVENGKILLEDVKTDTYPVSYTDRGIYEARLPEGFYKLTVSKKGFCPENRAVFQVKRSEKVDLNVILKVCSIEDTLSLQGSSSGFITKYRFPFKEDLLQINDSDKLKMQIQYGAKESGQDQVSYEASLNEDEPIRVTVKYNKDTLIADKIIFFTDKHVFHAVGNVMVYRGTHREKFEDISFNVQNGSISLFSLNR
jgi:hypothetical protein